VYFLHTMEDSFRLHRHLLEENPKRVVIVGGGYIGLEMADALTHRGLAVRLIGGSETVLPTVDPHFGHMNEAELRAAWSRGE
jgi:pyruvate/2-oxoglutarate dehydrogenase complex dihydrolipoamide dehydrogenase (E3) component